MTGVSATITNYDPELQELEWRYRSIAPWFPTWVRLVEYETRRREIKGVIPGQSSLVLSPPNDPFITMLAGANRLGSTAYLFFTRALGKRFQATGDGEINLIPGYHIPFQIRSERFDAIYANCLFDFCAQHAVPLLLKECLRILKTGHRLYAVTMDRPQSYCGKWWQKGLQTFPKQWGGCHPVNLLPYLTRHTLLADQRLSRLGFPLRLIIVRKETPFSPLSGGHA